MHAVFDFMDWYVHPCHMAGSTDIHRARYINFQMINIYNIYIYSFIQQLQPPVDQLVDPICSFPLRSGTPCSPEVWRHSFWMMHHGSKSPKRTCVWSNRRSMIEKLVLSPVLEMDVLSQAV